MGYVPDKEYFLDCDQTSDRTYGSIDVWSWVERISVYGAAFEQNPTTARLFEDDGSGGKRPAAPIRAWLDAHADGLHADLYRPLIDPFDKYEALARDWKLSVKFKRQGDRDFFVTFLQDMVAAR